MGVDPDVPMGFTAIRLTFDVESDADAAALDSSLEATERYCVVLQTLLRSPSTAVSRR